jgi:hypothetical protein
MTRSEERARRYVALLLSGLLAMACSSDDEAPLDTTGTGGSDSGADHGASGGSDASTSDSSSGGSLGDASPADVVLESAPDVGVDSTGEVGTDAESDASDTGSVLADATSEADATSDIGDAADVTEVSSDVVETGSDVIDATSDVIDAGSDVIDASTDVADAGDADATNDATDASPCGPCPSGLCLDGGICAACTGDLQCQGGAWRCELNTHTCVPCLPGATDNCPAGQYCTSQFACVPGCKANADCTSGACTNHECEHCQNDLECSGGNVCGTTVCAAACAGPAACAAGFDCCTGHCVDLTKDIRHCGGCGSPCNSSQFCGNTGCESVTIANVCDNATTTMVLDSFPSDDAANAVLQAGLVSNCTPPPTTGSSLQSAGGPINAQTGQPVAGGGNLITIAGGYYVHKLVDYLDQQGITPVYLARGVNDFWRYYERGGGADAGADGGASDLLIAEMAWTDSSASHDLILIELVRDPASGTLVLIAFGQYAESTAAAASYVANQMLPVANRSSYDKSWYVYEWTAASDSGPETFTLKASGN